MQIRVDNRGPEIAATNYWTTPHAAQGLAYLTANAGTMRVLLPDAIAQDVLAAIKTSRLVILSRGPWTARGVRDAVEILLEDDSESPYALHVDARQTERLWGPADDGREIPCSFWVPAPAEGARKAAELPCRLRHVDEIPCLRSWE